MDFTAVAEVAPRQDDDRVTPAAVVFDGPIRQDPKDILLRWTADVPAARDNGAAVFVFVWHTDLID